MQTATVENGLEIRIYRSAEFIEQR